jgi:hypothetical protein
VQITDVSSGYRCVDCVCEEENEENGSDCWGRSLHVLLEADLENNIEEYEIDDEEDEKAPNCLVDVPKTLFVIYEPNHYK